jgi:hypothetical protein
MAGTSRHLPYEQRTELRCPVRRSVPLSRSLPPPSIHPLGPTDRRQVLRELRVTLCQSGESLSNGNRQIRHFCPALTLFCLVFPKTGATINQIGPFFPQLTPSRSEARDPGSRDDQVLSLGRQGTGRLDASTHPGSQRSLGRDVLGVHAQPPQHQPSAHLHRTGRRRREDRL